ncbi:diguanylate cyclase (GGDEF)-like protein [Litorivivens lipolytica]|uniref:diguanylate cyclase n=1 Tax=Litorivivens lipolytica TaxID=1524264 RepID=A0A7W4W6Z7_9GAMM|nr:diguanylate cyclase response regulator [Litorivivens lipolytica]MBB3048208.1 diguanylate cyclase (GGDEF)-like protein [Litorivivens lipolytica]
MDQTSRNVLIIDDSYEDATLISRMLEKNPNVRYEIEIVNNYCDAALRLTTPFDICLLDQNLGGATGLDLLRTVEGTLLPGPVIMVTGSSSQWLDESALEAGVCDYLPKQELTPALLDRSIRYAMTKFSKDKELRRIASHDSLTDAFNRRYFSELCDRALDDFNVCGRVDNLSIVYIDIDNFKSINDTHGHQAGDLVLCIISKRIANRIRANEVLARIGGDEFAIYIPDSSKEQVEAEVTRLRNTIAEPIDIGDGKKLIVEASIGVSRYPDQGKSIEDLLKQADAEMYSDKEDHRAPPHPVRASAH